VADAADIAVIASSWSGLTEALELAGVREGKLAGRPSSTVPDVDPALFARTSADN